MKEKETTMKKVFDTLLSLEGQREIFRRYTILMNQIGDLGKVIEYAYGVYKVDLKTDPAYRAELKIALADSIIQLLLLAYMYDFDYNELLDLGIARLFEWTLKRSRSKTNTRKDNFL
jgi:hypothetical protein